MLDPAVSAAIKKFGVLKYVCMEFPHLVFTGTLALTSSALAVYFGYQRDKENEKTKYFLKYVVMRPTDPQLKNTVIWGEDGKPIN